MLGAKPLGVAILTGVRWSKAPPALPMRKVAAWSQGWDAKSLRTTDVTVS